jgi:hypothetical protein
MRLNASGVLVTTNDASISGLTVGKGTGGESTATVVGAGAMAASNTGVQNTAIGGTSMAANTSGFANTALGFGSLATNTTGASNTALGRFSLNVNLGGGDNTAVGRSSLLANTSGGSNTAIGRDALQANTTASNNTAVGYQAGFSNTTGQYNTAIGQQVFYNNTTGSNNTAIGSGIPGVSFSALQSNTTGDNNTAMGVGSLGANTTASNNTAVGYQAGYSQTTGANNTFLGRFAGFGSTTAGGSVVIGNAAGYTGGGDFNVFIGTQTGYNSTGSSNTFVGAYSSTPNGCGFAMTTGSKNTILGGYSGNQGGLDIRTASNYIVLSDGDGNPRAFWDTSGAAFTSQASAGNGSSLIVQTARTNFTNVAITSLCAAAAGAGWYHFGGYSSSYGATNILIFGNGNIQNTNGSYGSFSDVKLKENIVDATPKLDDLMKVKVRNYNLKNDDSKLKQIGVVAQELEEVFAGLVEETPDRDKEGNILETTTKGVKYSVFVPMLIKAVQELNTKLEAQALEIATLKGN